MKGFIERVRLQGWGRRARTTVTLGLSVATLAACDDLLEVELPAELTDDVLVDPAGASMQLNAAIGHFENAFNSYFWELHGREDGGEVFARSPGTNRGALAYETGSDAWFNGFHTSRSFAQVLHRKLENDWTDADVPERKQWLAVTSLYAGAALSILGSSLCEVAIDNGSLQQPGDIYTMAGNVLTRALTEIDAAGGDFEMPYGIGSSARSMAHGLRAQLLWMMGDMAGALTDAEKVPQGFMAFVTREAVPERRNFAFLAGGGGGGQIAEVIGVIDWWQGPQNPVTGQAWPNILPFTGYVDLGILPDGRAVRDDGLPIRTSGPYRTAVEDQAVPDPRVPTEMGIIQGKGGVERPTNTRYKGEGDDIPLVNWKEMVLIRAEFEGGQKAIDLVNELRAYDNLPLVTYADPANAQQIRFMLIEERRRALWLEGRYFYTKLKNPDILWFPRGVGQTPEGGLNLEGGVRFLMPDEEYILNPNLTMSDRATGCDPHQAPVLNVG